jgi:[methyl-Co(III) methanol-specific corrinoid protein]:coenzyme M methyltransferase
MTPFDKAHDLQPTERHRLQAVLTREAVDRPPVICPGGMMNAAIVEIMQDTGHSLPAAHADPELMAALAADVHQATGFENLGAPFCMTVEAEVLGSEITLGSLECEPKIQREAFASVTQVTETPVETLLTRGRVPVVAAAVRLLASRYPSIPVLGNLTGPVSTAASIVDPMRFLKELRKEREHAHRVMAYVTEFLLAYARLLGVAGVTAIAIGDPTATGEILGPKMFEEYALQYLNRLIDGIQASGLPVLLHICGNMNVARPLIPQLHSNAISTDALVNLRELKKEFPSLITMGNLSTYLLESGPAEKIARQTTRLVRDGINIIAPACGLSTSTSIAHIQTLTNTVKRQGAIV